MPLTLSDEELMSQVRGGAGEMLGTLFDRYHGKLFSYFVRLTGDRALAEDLVQDVFYRILKRRHTYRPGSPFRPWMYQIARNARNDNFRRRTEVELDEQMAEPVMPKDDLADREQNRLLHRALMKLLGCEVGTIKTRVFRAMQELRQLLAELEAPPRLRPGTGNLYEM